MRPYLKPSIFILSGERLGVKLQGSGAELLVCEGTECGMTLGASCHVSQPPYYYYFVEINLFEEGVTCPVSALPSCVVEAMTVNGQPVTDPGSHCQVMDSEQCDTGCGITMICDSFIYCNAYYGTISATVSCSGFSEPISCISE